MIASVSAGKLHPGWFVLQKTQVESDVSLEYTK